QASVAVDDPGGGGERGERRGQHHRTRAGATAAVRGGEGLVQVDVHGVDAEVAGADAADDGVEIGAVAVKIGAGFVRQAGDLEDVALEEAAGIGVGDHDRSDVGAELGGEVGEVDATVRGLSNFADGVAYEGGGGGVGAVGGSRHQDRSAVGVA